MIRLSLPEVLGTSDRARHRVRLQHRQVRRQRVRLRRRRVRHRELRVSPTG